MEGKVQSLIKKHKAVTGFFTAMTNMPGNEISTQGNFQTIIGALQDFILQKENTEAERSEAQVFLDEYRRLTQVTLLALAGKHRQQ